MELVKQNEKKSFDLLKADFGYKNKLRAPKLVKVIVTSGTGSIQDKNKKEIIIDRLTKITGQKPVSRKAKKSIATFKLREGEVVGQQVTLRGERMYDFLNRLLHIALPRTRDFKGLPRTSFDEVGNYHLGIKENIVFPETPDEEIRDIFGLGITVVTTAKTKKEAEAFLGSLGFPFRKK